ncbi:MAG TPA: hypothetical protein VGJ33_00965 [Candidatus Angelobacter sp.]|jgi:hypothetical protein
MREDGETPALAFDNMQDRHLIGTTEWTQYSITMPVHPEANQLSFGVLINGTGKLWADDLELLVDGKPVWNAPKSDRPSRAQLHLPAAAPWQEVSWVKWTAGSLR